MDFTGERFIPDTGLGGELESEHYLRYHAVGELVRDKVVLDAASGEGYGSSILARHARAVFGLEIDPQAVAQARARYQAPGLSYTRGSIADLPFPAASFDVVVSFETIEHVSAGLQEAFLAEIKRVLRPDGVLVISTPDRRLYSDLPGYHNEFHVKEFYREEFLGFLHQQFGTVKFWEQTALLAYLLTDGQEESLRRLLPGEGVQGKYVVALCANGALPPVQLGAVALDREGLYRHKVDRVVALQDEIDEKNRHIQIVLRDISITEETVRKQDLLLRDQGQRATSQEMTISQLQASLDACQHRTSAMEAALRESQIQLTHIQATRAWRLIKTLYRWKDKIIRQR